MTNDVYETSENATEHNPYDTKVGGKPAATLADGTVPTTVKQKANTADGTTVVASKGSNQDDDNTQPTASDAAVKLAEENGIDLATVTGTGKGGNITKSDVQAAIDAKAE